MLGFDFGLLSNFASWALIAAAGVKIGVQSLESRVKSGGTRFPDAAHGFAGAAMAAALGFVCLSVFLIDAPASIRTAAAISTVGYAVLAAEREASRPRFANLQAACALGLFALGLALTWDKYSPIAIASTLSLGFALFMATRRRSRGWPRRRSPSAASPSPSTA